MFDRETEILLQKSLKGLPSMVCNRSLKHDIDDLVAMALPVKALAVVDDRNTAQALGDQVFRALKTRFSCTRVTLEGHPSADMAVVDYLRQKTSASDALIAVGSGTIADLCKYASFLDHKPYIVFPTAASMNGYCSASASIAVDGYKKTCVAHMPKVVLCDLSVIAAAPARLAKSGLGDSLARSTAQADWLLSHLLLGSPYDETPFALLAPFEPQLLENARGIASGNMESIELLLKILLLSGLGMTIAGGSYPASQGEHMIAHAMHMLQNVSLPQTLHGEEIGVTTLAMARLQEALLRYRPALREDDFDDGKMAALFGKFAANEAKKAFAVKQALMSPRAQSRGLKDSSVTLGMTNWDAIAEKIERIMIPSERLQSVLDAAQAPTAPQALGWNEEDYKTVTASARFLRDRFTFLDLQY